MRLRIGFPLILSKLQADIRQWCNSNWMIDIPNGMTTACAYDRASPDITPVHLRLALVYPFSARSPRSSKDSPTSAEEIDPLSLFSEVEEGWKTMISRSRARDETLTGLLAQLTTWSLSSDRYPAIQRRRLRITGMLREPSGLDAVTWIGRMSGARHVAKSRRGHASTFR